MAKELFCTGSFTDYMYTWEFDTDHEEITLLEKIFSPRRSAYFSMSEDKNILYVANENFDGEGGITAFSLSDRRKPRLINAAHSHTRGPAHSSVAQIGNRYFAIGAGFFDGDITVFSICPDGALGEMTCFIQLYGGGPFVNHKGKNFGQESARAHCIRQVPGTQFILCTDLGSDKVYTFSLSEHGVLTETEVCCFYPGSGPRHFVFHHDGELVYLITEISSVIIVCDFDKKTGKLRPKQYCSAQKQGITGNSWCSAIRLSPDKRFLYGSNRSICGDDSICVFSLEDGGNRLCEVGYLCEQVHWPRDMVIDPSGDYLLVGNEKRNEITVNRICHNTGMPKYIGKSFPVENGPASLIFL